jgi:hypothetical protein
MAHTKEQRDKQALCGARKKNGEKCRAFAGQGTQFKGVPGVRCKYHGGATPSHQKHAATLEAQQRMIKLGGPIEIPPLDALLAMLYISSGHVAWLREEIAALDDLPSDDGPALLTLYGEERDRVAKVAKACLDAGVAERQVALAERYGEQLAAVLGAIFEDKELGLADKQRAALPAVLRRHLFALEQDDHRPLAIGRPSSNL